MRKRPFLLLACMFLFGVLFALYGPVFAVPAVLLVLHAAPWKEKGARRLLLSAGLSALFFGGILDTRQELIFRQQYLPKLSDGQEVRLSGKLMRIEPKTKCVYYYLTDCAVSDGENTFAANDVIAYVSDAGHSIGQILLIEGTISQFTKASNEGMFDARSFYQSQKIDFGVWVGQVCGVYGEPDRFRCALMQLRTRLSAVINASVNDDGVLSAMLLGEKSALDGEIKTLYQKAGIAHVLAISGLHVSLLGMGLYRILRKRLTLPYVPSAAATAAFLLSFAVLSGNSVSTQRAVVMCLLQLLADVCGREYDMLNALGASVLWLLVQNPFLVGYSGFLLSVLAVLAIGMGGAVFTAWYRLFAGQKRGFWKRQKEGLLVSLAIQLFTLPVIAYCYYEIPVYAMLVNLFVLAVVDHLLGLTVLGTAAGLFWPLAGKMVLAPCGLLLLFYRFCCETSLALPGAQFICGQPRPLQMFLYYAGLGGFLLVLRARVRMEKREGTERKTRTVRIASYLHFAGVLALLFLILFFPQKREQEIDFLDVGQGDGIYICTSDKTPLFLDGGSSDAGNVGTYRILPFLKAKGVDHIAYWFVSHTDEDHILGLREALQSGYEIWHLVFAAASKDEEETRALAALAKENGTDVFYMEQGETLHLNKASLTCLFPDAAEQAEDKNERCLTLLYTDGAMRALFAGDSSAEVEERLLAAAEPVDIFKADHHGSRYANSAAFLKALSPTVTVASAGANNRYGHPSADAVKRIKDSGSRFYCTAECGRVRIVLRGGRVCCEPYD